MTKERMKDLLIVGMLPFVIVACKTTDFSYLTEACLFVECFEARQCDIVHENAPPGLKCDTFESRVRP